MQLALQRPCLTLCSLEAETRSKNRVSDTQMKGMGEVEVTLYGEEEKREIAS